ncbi:hypothetical protein [Vibrio phage vB_VpaP_SJSY21]|nr:hypothetical protein [Vibrio phage vB_VpaP_SJSY21]
MLAVKEDIVNRIASLEKEVTLLDYKGCEHCGHLSEEQIGAFTKKGELENLIREYHGVLDLLED